MSPGCWALSDHLKSIARPPGPSGSADRQSRDGQVQLGPRGPGADLRDLLPLPSAGVPLQPGRPVGVDGPVDDEVEAFPAGAMISVGVDEEHHPVRAGPRGQGRPRPGVEEDGLRVAGDLASHQVVAARSVDVVCPAGAVVIARARVARVVEELGGDVLSRHRSPRRCRSTSGLEALGIAEMPLYRRTLRRELIVVAVTVPALHRLDVAAVLAIELVDELDRGRRACPIGRRPTRSSR